MVPLQLRSGTVSEHFFAPKKHGLLAKRSWTFLFLSIFAPTCSEFAPVCSDFAPKYHGKNLGLQKNSAKLLKETKSSGNANQSKQDVNSSSAFIQ